jgi:hypothetical protein
VVKATCAVGGFLKGSVKGMMRKGVEGKPSTSVPGVEQLSAGAQGERSAAGIGPAGPGLGALLGAGPGAGAGAGAGPVVGEGPGAGAGTGTGGEARLDGPPLPIMTVSGGHANQSGWQVVNAGLVYARALAASWVGLVRGYCQPLSMQLGNPFAALSHYTKACPVW